MSAETIVPRLLTQAEREEYAKALERPTQKEMLLSALKTTFRWTAIVGFGLLVWVGLSRVLDRMFM